ncbi:MAG: DUF167 domain-containing protein [Candidatus Aenigmarchaeota archaeon]|nr:DUF167 domain-containing protein [Candidatus Aenigmarchaeota archaeon]
MLVEAKVHTNSKKFKLEIDGNTLIIHTKSPPENNKANSEIVKELTRRYGSCKIVRGKTSKKKLLELPVDKII